MQTKSDWTICGPDLASVLRQHPYPLDDLAAGAIPAIVLRKVFAESSCRSLIKRLISEQLLYDPRQPIPERCLETAIPEGYYREGKSSVPSFAWTEKKSTGRARIDIGTSLGYRGSDQESFLQHAAETHGLFRRLFAADNDPIRLTYDCLEQLSRDRRVVTAYEPGGRPYGPAIIRAHYGGYTYQPHFDSVRLREKRTDYAVYDFEHQLAGVLVLQNAQLGGRTAQCILHRQLWQPEIDSHLKAGTFHEYARQKGIENVEVRLDPGDLYFFNTRAIHEVPGVAGDLPRIVLATFIGYSKDRDEIFVWS